MKDFAGKNIEKGCIVVVKPSTRQTLMRFGFVKSTTGYTARVVSYSKSWWHGSPTLKEANFQRESIFVYSYENVDVFPEGFPKELQKMFKDFHKELSSNG